MTRRRIIAGVILLVAVAVPFVPGVWERVAYVEHEFGRMVVLEKRAAWLPGRTGYVPDQVCKSCSIDEHVACGEIAINFNLPGVPKKLDLNFVEELVFRVKRDVRGLQSYSWIPPPDFRCTCTDPSHVGDTE